MFRRAAREVRVVGGLLLIVGAAIALLVGLNRATARADRDFALCGGPRQAADCVSKRRPVSVGWNASSDNGFRREYEVAVQTRPNFTFSLLGMSKADVAPFEGLRTVEVRYRDGRLVALVAPDGTSLEVPFSFSQGLVIGGAAVVVLGLLGMGSVAWGLTRVNRSPRA